MFFYLNQEKGVHLGCMKFSWVFYLLSFIFFIPWELNTFFLFFLMFNLVSSSSMFYFMDSFSFWMVLLSIFVCILALMSGGHSVKKYFIIWFISCLTILFFMSLSLFFFFLIFEFLVVPMGGLILGWGYQSERLGALFFFMFYTLTFSIPFFLILLGMLNMYQASSLSICFKPFFLNIICVFLTLVFLVKSPLFFFHSWLPKAHVEASTSGSVLLAGTFLKTGTYGIYRFLKMCSLFYLKVLFFISFIAILFSLIICAYQSDLKLIIAYSSVCHMSSLLMSVCTFFSSSFKACIIISLSHGVSSPLLFMFSGSKSYFSNSRLIYFNEGGWFKDGVSGMFFPLLILSMGFPFILSFFGEVLVCLVSMLFLKLSSVIFLIMMIGYCFILVFIFMNESLGKPKIKKTLLWSFSSFSNSVFFIFLMILFFFIISWV